MNDRNLPLVSIIIAIRNEELHIEGCLTSIQKQDYPHHLLEVIIADGISTDNTKERIVSFSRKYAGLRIMLIDNPGQSMPIGFNHGLRHANGDVIIMLGGHAEIAGDYVTRCVRTLNEHQVSCVGGAMQTVASGWLSQAIANAMSSVFGVGGVAFRTSPKRLMEVDTTVFAAYRKQTFLEIGGLDEEMIRNQDDEFNYRVREFGGRILFDPSIRSCYHSRSNLKSLWIQYFQYGYWKVRVLQKHPLQMSLRQFVPPTFVLALLVCLFAAIFTSWGIWLLVAVAGSYLAANLSASLITAAKKGWKFLPLLPLTFVILHLSYGLGFLVGLVKFVNRWRDRLGKVPDWSGERITT